MPTTPIARRMSLLLAVPLLIHSTAAVADDAEAVFAAARAYTVQVRTSIPLGFVEDDQGVGTGAGFIVDRARGWIMTNAHVASHSPARVEVAFGTGRFVPAERLYVDPFLDIAIIRPLRPLPTEAGEASLDCGAPPGTGHPVGAFGHPWGLQYTGTRGIVSGRTSMLGGEMLQTDAPINAGNSGGPLISLRSGSIIGVNAATADGAQNTNFAVSMQHACRILRLLQACEDPSPPAPLLAFFELESREELVVARSFLPRGAIALEYGDRVLAVDGVAVSNEGQFVHELRGRLGDVSIRVNRRGREITLRGALPPAPAVLSRRGVLVGGMLLAPLNYRDVGSTDLGHDIGVHDVEPGSEAEANDLQYLDLLIAVNGEPVRDLDQLHGLLRQAARAGEEATLDFLRRARPFEDSLHQWLRRTIPVDGPQWITVTDPGSLRPIAELCRP
jgi:serine protease Do